MRENNIGLDNALHQESLEGAQEKEDFLKALLLSWDIYDELNADYNLPDDDVKRLKAKLNGLPVILRPLGRAFERAAGHILYSQNINRQNAIERLFDEYGIKIDAKIFAEFELGVKEADRELMELKRKYS